MTAQMDREKASDRLIRSIDVFDDTGQIIYSTDRRARGPAREPRVDRGRRARQDHRVDGRSPRGIRRGDLAEEQLRPHRGIPRAALLARLRRSRRRLGRARDHFRRAGRLRRHRPHRAPGPHRRDPPLRARPAHPRERGEPPGGPRARRRAHGRSLRHRHRPPAGVAARRQRRAGRAASQARRGGASAFQRNAREELPLADLLAARRRHHGVRGDRARGGVVLLPPRVRARAGARDREEGRHRGRLGARAGAQGHELRHPVLRALRRGQDLRGGLLREPRVLLCRHHQQRRHAALPVRQGAPGRARALPQPRAARRDARPDRAVAGRPRGPAVHRVAAHHRRHPAPGRAAHGDRLGVRRPGAPRGDARRARGAGGVALLHAGAAQLHGRGAARLGARGIRPAGRAHALGRLHRDRARARQRRDRPPASAHRLGVDHLNVRYEHLSGRAAGQACAASTPAQREALKPALRPSSPCASASASAPRPRQPTATR